MYNDLLLPEGEKASLLDYIPAYVVRKVKMTIATAGELTAQWEVIENSQEIQKTTKFKDLVKEAKETAIIPVTKQLKVQIDAAEEEKKTGGGRSKLQFGEAPAFPLEENSTSERHKTFQSKQILVLRGIGLSSKRCTGLWMNVAMPDKQMIAIVDVYNATGHDSDALLIHF